MEPTDFEIVRVTSPFPFPVKGRKLPDGFDLQQLRRSAGDQAADLVRRCFKGGTPYNPIQGEYLAPDENGDVVCWVHVGGFGHEDVLLSLPIEKNKTEYAPGDRVIWIMDPRRPPPIGTVRQTRYQYAEVDWNGSVSPVRSEDLELVNHFNEEVWHPLPQ